MAAIGEALAALITQATSTEVQAAQQYVVFPSFFFPITSDSLATDDRPAAFDFMHRINMIPAHPPQFALSADFVWKIYRQVLTDRQTAPSTDGQEGYAKRFAGAVAQMGDGAFTPTEDSYFITTVMPTDIESPSAWARVSLGGDMIRSLAAALPESEKQWFTRFNTLSVLGEDIVESLSFERLVLVILRPWYDPSIFGLRFWRLDGDPISDGGDPPQGRMPGVATKLVLVRDFKLKLAAVRLPDIGPTIMYRTVGTEVRAPVLTPSAQLIQLSASQVQPLMRAKPLRADGGAISKQIKNLQVEAPQETGAAAPPSMAGAGTASSGAQKFHVPFSFDTIAARGVAQADLDRTSVDVAAKRADRSSLKGRIDELKAEIARIDARPRGGGGMFRLPDGATFSRNKLALDLAFSEQALPATEEALSAAEQEMARCNRALEVLDQIEGIQVDASAFVLALVCDRVPKAPDPDSALFT
jgi:hypothetical protein